MLEGRGRAQRRVNESSRSFGCRDINKAGRVTHLTRLAARNTMGYTRTPSKPQPRRARD